jgi:hypothetical protein
MQVTPARVASLLAGTSALLGALAPAVANLDTTSTAGIGAGLLAILVIFERFLVGQRAYEARITTIDGGDDGDDALPVELEGQRVAAPPADEIDVPA